ncbi:MAG TPA: endonuclease/exonuclease/phosphatase family protein [Coleofasciculaceae cyanobacterium]
MPMRLKQAGRFLFSLPFWINILAGGVTLATLLSFASPLWWVFAMLEHFRLQYCLVLVVALLVGLISREPWQIKYWSLLWTIPLIINFGLLLPVFIGAVQNREDGIVGAVRRPTLLRVLHATLDRDNLADVSKAINYINQQAPDIVSLLEITPQSLPELQTGLAGYQVVIAEPRTNSHGSAWFVSKQPSSPITIQESELIHLPSDSDRPLLRATITFAGKPIDLLCFHAIRPRNTSTVNYQQVELAALAQWSQNLLQNKQGNVIVIGDFNSTPWYGPFRRMLHDSELVNSQAGFGLQPSWHSGLPSFLRLPIDHCLHSRSFVTVRRSVGPNIGSDHLPLLVYLRLT